MALLTNSPAETRMRLMARESFSLTVMLQLASGKPAVITDHSFNFVLVTPLYQGGAVLINQPLEIMDDSEGWTRLVLQATDMDIPPGEYPFAISVVTEQDYSAVLCKGTIEIVYNPNPDMGPNFVGPGSAASMTLTLEQNNSLTVSVEHLPQPRLEIGEVRNVPYWWPAKVFIEGSYPTQRLSFEIPGPGNLDTGTAPSLANIPPGSVIAIIWDGGNWKIGATVVTARPTARTDLTMHLIDPVGNAVLPVWAITNDLFDRVL